MVASLLIIAGVLILIADLFVEGFGLGGVAGLGLLALFFWGHYLAGLTGWEDLALIVLGLVLIAIEIIVVPGFGIPGVLGLIALFGGLFLAMLGRDIQTPAGIEQAALTVVVSLVAVLVGVVALFLLLSRGRHPHRLVLHSAVGGAEVAHRPQVASWLRHFGATSHLPREEQSGPPGAQKTASAQPIFSEKAPDIALTDLRPSGIASIAGERVDVVTAGEHIAAGDPVEVVLDEGYRRVVRKVGI
jgi:membrane-bound serine protease (ClpP class)